jgi:hypothetical protein
MGSEHEPGCDIAVESSNDGASMNENVSMTTDPVAMTTEHIQQRTVSKGPTTLIVGNFQWYVRSIG